MTASLWARGASWVSPLRLRVPYPRAHRTEPDAALAEEPPAVEEPLLFGQIGEHFRSPLVGQVGRLRCHALPFFAGMNDSNDQHVIAVYFVNNPLVESLDEIPRTSRPGTPSSTGELQPWIRHDLASGFGEFRPELIAVAARF